MDALHSEIQELLEAAAGKTRADDSTMDRVLDRILDHFSCVVGTIHRLDSETGRLALLAQRGIPPQILPQVTDIPVGKGMAGLAAARRRPVQSCNLQQDDTGDVRPAAKETEMKGSIAVPMLVENEVHGTLGVAKPETYEFHDDEVQRLEKLAELLGRHFGS